jgi:benzoyl-CoA-dihydrodiol lyase
LKLAEQSNRPANTKGVNLSRLNKTSDEAGLHYGFVDVQCDRVARTATITVRTPESVSENSLEKAIAAGANWWPLQMARELDDAILTLRTSELDLGLWIIKASGNPDAVLAIDDFILSHQENWFVREVLGMIRRTLARIDVTSRSIYAIVEPGSCFAGTMLELAVAADRIYMRDTQEGDSVSTMTLSKMNFGPLPMVNKLSRLAARFYGDETQMARLRGKIGKKLSARESLDAGLVSAARVDGTRSQSALWTGRNVGDTNLWPVVRLAELDFHPPERGGGEWSAEGVWNGRAGEIQLGKGLMDGLEPGLPRRSR